jgi:hypothetical protein
MTEKSCQTFNNHVTHYDLVRFLSYDMNTGIFTWKMPLSKAVSAGSVAGSIATKGYRRISIGGVTYAAHRLAWYYVHGEWPAHQIDHINGVRDDNRICNLRVATPSQNVINSAVRSDNSSGVRGVSWHKRMNKWTARINIDKKTIWLGAYATKEDAELAYRTQAQHNYAGFTRNG